MADTNRKRICIFCKHFDIQSGWPTYSEYTPGESFSMTCAKGVWEFDPHNETLDSYRTKMLTAGLCSHFEAADDIQEPERA